MRHPRLLILAALLLAACASHPRKIPGRYGVVFDASFGSRGFAHENDVVMALRDRLAAVDVVSSTEATPYDAIIVVRPSMIVPVRSVTAPPAEGAWSLDPSVRYVSFSIERAGRAVAEGSAAFDQTGSPDEGQYRAFEQVSRSHRAGIEIARAIVNALRDTT